MSKNEFCVVDAGPLITFVTGDALDELSAAGDQFKFKVLDVVAYEVGRRDKPGGIEVSNWIEKMEREGKLDIIHTEVGQTLLEGRKENPNFRLKGAGEQAIAEWLHNGGADSADNTIVIYEDNDTKKLLQSMDRDANIVGATTRAFLIAAEGRGIIDSADATWQKIHANSPTRTDVIHSLQASTKAPAP